MANRRKISAARSPYYSNHVGSAGFTIGAETTNTITVNIQLKDVNLNDLSARGEVTAYLSGDANGDTVSPIGPSGGVAAGSDGLLIPAGRKQSVTLAKGTLAIHSTPEQFKTTSTAVYIADGAQYSKSAATGLTFSAGHTVTASTYGIILVQVNAAGTVSTKVPAATQAYASAALALAALPLPDAGKAALGYIAIANNSGDWVANTDDLTNGSDLTTATFVDIEEPGPALFRLISESDGDIDVVVTETGVRTHYLILVMPDGRLVASGALAFA